MRTLAITQNISVDGAIEMLDDWFDGPAQADQSDMMAELRRGMAESDALLVGRVTFTRYRVRPHPRTSRG